MKLKKKKEPACKKKKNEPADLDFPPNWQYLTETNNNKCYQRTITIGVVSASMTKLPWIFRG